MRGLAPAPPPAAGAPPALVDSTPVLAPPWARSLMGTGSPAATLCRGSRLARGRCCCPAPRAAAAQRRGRPTGPATPQIHTSTAPWPRHWSSGRHGPPAPPPRPACAVSWSSSVTVGACARAPAPPGSRREPDRVFPSLADCAADSARRLPYRRPPRLVRRPRPAAILREHRGAQHSAPALGPAASRPCFRGTLGRAAPPPTC